MTLLRHIAALLLLTGGLATPALAEPALWKVNDADSSIYLFGSVHVFTKQMDWRTPQFDAILNSADHVYFEVVMDIEAYWSIARVSLTQGMLRDGLTLAEVLTADDHARLVAAAEMVGMPAAKLEHLQPWLAALTLTGAAYPKTTAGVDLLVDAEVAPDRKRGLETAAQQMGFVADMPIDVAVAYLMSTVAGIESGVLMELDPLIDAWHSGDTSRFVDAIEAQMTEADQPIYDRLLTDRNKQWLSKLDELLATNDESLVIVGAAHLIGADGVPALLADKGYSVERVDQSPAGARH